jgi:hypothetical protein
MGQQDDGISTGNLDTGDLDTGTSPPAVDSVVDLTDLEELEALRAENEWLKAQLATTQRPASSGPRRWIAAVLVLLFALSLVPTVLVGWFTTTVLDEDAFVSTFQPLPSDPAVSGALAVVVTDSLLDPAETTAAVESALPPDLTFLAAPVGEALRDVTADLTRTVIASDEFAAGWRTGLRLAHRTMIGILAGTEDGLIVSEDGAIAIDLSGPAAEIQQTLAERGFDFLPEPTETGAGIIVLYESDSLAAGQSIAGTLYDLRWILPLITIALAAGAIWVAHDRRKIAAWLGSGAALSMLLTLIGVRMSASATIGSIEDEVIRAGAESASDIVLGRLLAVAWSILLVGLIVAFVAWWFGPSDRAVRWRDGFSNWQAARRDGVTPPTGLAAFVTKNRRTLQWGAVIVAGLVLLIIPNPSPWLILLIGALLLAFVVAVEVVGGKRPPEVVEVIEVVDVVGTEPD